MNDFTVYEIQAGLNLHDFFCAISLYCNFKIYTIFWIYKIIFGLMGFGIDDSWPHLSSVGG